MRVGVTDLVGKHPPRALAGVPEVDLQFADLWGTALGDDLPGDTWAGGLCEREVPMAAREEGRLGAGVDHLVFLEGFVLRVLIKGEHLRLEASPGVLQVQDELAADRGRRSIVEQHLGGDGKFPRGVNRLQDGGQGDPCCFERPCS